MIKAAETFAYVAPGNDPFSRLDRERRLLADVMRLSARVTELEIEGAALRLVTNAVTSPVTRYASNADKQRAYRQRKKVTGMHA